MLGLQRADFTLPEREGVAAVSRAFLSIIIAFIAFHLVLVGLAGFNAGTALFRAGFAGLLVLGVARALLALGWVRTGTWLGSLTVLAVGLFAGWFAANIGLAQAAWTFVGLSYCTLVLGLRQGAIAATISLAAHALLAVAIEQQGLRSQIVPHPFNQWLNLFTPSMVLLVAMGLIRKALIESARRHFRASAAIANEKEERLAATQAAAAELERQVALRTRELEQAVKDLRTLTYQLSHDLAGKVSVIRSFSTLLAQREAAPLSGEGRHMLARVEDNARQLQGMIDGLLTYSRNSVLKPCIEDVDADAVMAEVARDAAQAWPQAKIEWQLGRLATDRVMLRHILQNLVVNACKHGAASDSPMVRVGRVDRDGFATVNVDDNGPGFDQRDHQRLFELFQRGGEHAEGHGVGLAVVKHLVERLGGRAWAESTGSGARFSFSLPLPGGGAGTGGTGPDPAK